MSAPHRRPCPCGCWAEIGAADLSCRDSWARLPGRLQAHIIAAARTARSRPHSAGAAAALERRLAEAAVWWRANPHAAPRRTRPHGTPPTSPWELVPCSSCRAPLVWGETLAGLRIGVDAEAIPVNTGAADVILHDRPGRPPLATMVDSQAQLFGRRWAWRTHLSTCPHAALWRARARSWGPRAIPPMRSL